MEQNQEQQSQGKEVVISFDDLKRVFGWYGNEVLARADDSLSGMENEDGQPVYWGNFCFDNIQLTGRFSLKSNAVRLVKGTTITYFKTK